MKRYDQVPHTADLAARIYGKTLTELFENAAFAMFDMMADLEGLIQEEEVEISVEAPDLESLLIFWLNEVLYTAYTKSIFFTEFHVISLNDNGLTVSAKGGPLGLRNRIKNEIKAATFHDVRIGETDDGYEVTVVFDI